MLPHTRHMRPLLILRHSSSCICILDRRSGAGALRARRPWGSSPTAAPPGPRLLLSLSLSHSREISSLVHAPRLRRRVCTAPSNPIFTCCTNTTAPAPTSSSQRAAGVGVLPRAAPSARPTPSPPPPPPKTIHRKHLSHHAEKRWSPPLGDHTHRLPPAALPSTTSRPPARWQSG